MRTPKKTLCITMFVTINVMVKPLAAETPENPRLFFLNLSKPAQKYCNNEPWEESDLILKASGGILRGS